MRGHIGPARIIGFFFEGAARITGFFFKGVARITGFFFEEKHVLEF